MIYLFKFKGSSLKYYLYAKDKKSAEKKAWKALSGNAENVILVRTIPLSDFAMIVEGGKFFEV